MCKANHVTSAPESGPATTVRQGKCLIYASSVKRGFSRSPPQNLLGRLTRDSPIVECESNLCLVKVNVEAKSEAFPNQQILHHFPMRVFKMDLKMA